LERLTIGAGVEVRVGVLVGGTGVKVLVDVKVFVDVKVKVAVGGTEVKVAVGGTQVKVGVGVKIQIVGVRLGTADTSSFTTLDIDEDRLSQVITAVFDSVEPTRPTRLFTCAT